MPGTGTKIIHDESIKDVQNIGKSALGKKDHKVRGSFSEDSPSLSDP